MKRCFYAVFFLASLAACSTEAGDDGDPTDSTSEDEALTQCPAAPAQPSDEHFGAAGQVRIWTTREVGDGAEIAKDADVAFAPAGAGGPEAIDVDDTKTFQTVHGFGGAMTDSSAWMLQRLPCGERQKVMQRLFDPKSGIGLSVMRQPIGASDFTQNGPYSYDEPPGGGDDASLSHFSIAHDKKYILPIVREARRLNPALSIVASPWSPPAFMKTNRSMLNGGDSGKLRGDMYGPYAEYLVKFVQAYEAEGVKVDALTPQNEPGQQTDYPGMDLNEPAEADLLAKELFPRLDKAKLGGLKVFGFDYNWATAFPDGLLADGRIKNRLHGIAFHCYGGSPTVMNAIHDGGKETWVTECTSASGPAQHHGRAIEQLIRSTRNSAGAFLTWNLVLGKFANGEDGFPHTGHGCTNCIGAVTIENGKPHYTRDFSDLGQASKFVRPGAVRIQSNTFSDFRNTSNASDKGGLEDVAFKNTDGSIVVVAFNSSDAPIAHQIRWRGQAITHTLAARSAATFVWK